MSDKIGVEPLDKLEMNWQNFVQVDLQLVAVGDQLFLGMKIFHFAQI